MSVVRRSVVRRSSRARVLRRRKKRSQTVVDLQTRIRGFGSRPASRGSGRRGGAPVPHDGGCGRLTERFPSRGRRASTAFARKPVVSSARPARRDAGATKTRHRRRRRFSRRDGPASRARRERERATYLDGAERRGGGKGEGGHLRGLYVNGAFVVCRAPPPTSVSTRAHSFVSPFRELPLRSTVERRRAIDGLILESKCGAFFRPREKSRVPVSVSHKTQHRLSKRHFRENNNAK